MSKAQNNHQNSRLKQLLSEADKAGADDFEREALEGFASLQNEEEALQLKAELDAEIGPAVFTATKKQNKAAYWMAAAALIVMVGFTIYFIQKDPLVAPQKLAEHKVEPPPSEVKVNPSNVEPDLPAVPPQEKAKALIQQSLPTTAKDNDQKPAKEMSEPVLLNEENAESKKEEVVSVTSTFDGASAAPPRVNTSEADKAGSSGNFKRLEVEIKNSGKTQEVEAANAPASEAKQKMAKANFEREALAKTPQTVSVPTSMACDYLGGMAAFKKDVDRVLKPLDLKALKLKGSIVLWPNKQVMYVTLTEKGDLSKRDTKKVMEALKTLSAFELPNTGSADFYYYNFEYSN